MSSVFSPGWIAITCAMLLPLIPKKARKAFMVLIPVLSYAYLLDLKSEVGSPCSQAT